MAELPTSAALERYGESHPNESAVISRYQGLFFDSFMDALGCYIEWRARVKKPRGFLERLLRESGVGQWIPHYSTATLRTMLAKGSRTLLINDDMTISLALSELVVQGRVGRALEERALVCVRRQMTGLLMDKRGYDDRTEALEMFREVERLLQGATRAAQRGDATDKAS